MKNSYFVYVADVYCPWCYAFAPIMQRIAKENPDLPVKVYGGNLVSNPTELTHNAAMAKKLSDFWQEVEQESGRSLAGALNALAEKRNVRQYSPGADEILTVLKKSAPGHELEQLVELEDLYYGEGRDLFTDETLNLIAKRWNLDPKQFETALDQPAAYQATEQALEEASRLMGDIESYPTILLVRGNKVDVVSRGYVHYETVAARLEDAKRDLGLEELPNPHHSRHHGGALGKADA